jgi:hypothetical protein
MPTDSDTSSRHDRNGQGRISTALILLTLPWLSFLHEILEIIKKDLQERAHTEDRKTPRGDDSYIKHIQRLLAAEVHAFLMVFDRSRTLRKLFGEDLEEKLVNAFTEIAKKMASGSVSIIEAQQTVLAHLTNILKKTRAREPVRKRPRAG